MFLQLEELESNLFGSLTAASNDFGKELEEQSLRLPSRSIQVGTDSLALQLRLKPRINALAPT